MRKMGLMKFVIAAITIVATCIGFTGCLDDAKDVYKGKDSEEPNAFNFSTNKTVEFTLKYDVPTGYRVHVELYSKSPLTLDAYKSYVKDSTLVPFFSGKADDNGRVTYKGDLPATINEVYAYCSGFGMPVLMKASVNDAGGVSDFKVAEIPAASSTRATTGASGTNSWKTYNVTISKPTLPVVNRTIQQEDKNLIEKAFPTNQNYDIVRTYYQSSIELLDRARVKIYSVSNGSNSNRTNSLAYFVYNNKNVQPADINSDLKLVFPELNKTVPAEGTGYQLLNNGQEVFEAGTHIGFALFPDTKINEIGSDKVTFDNTNVFYSCFSTGGWNTYTFPAKNSSTEVGLARASVPHMVLTLLRKTADGHAIIAIAFEDQPWSTTYGTNKGDFRDDVFILEVDPASSLPDLPTPPSEEPTYDSEYNYSGILCFEDSWPEKGDYDMNDVVISYNRTLCVSDKNGPVAMKETYTFLNNGAEFTNGFGYQLTGLKKSDIMKCEVKSDYICQNQGLDITLEDATVMLFDNAKLVKPKTTFTVYTSFTNGGFYWAQVNPFIVVRKFGATDDYLSQGRTEVHLPTTQNAMTKYLPTSKANTTYWGTSDDKSDPDKKMYYVRSGNYPFALEINSSALDNFDFVIPQEKNGIENTYPDFTKWVNSNGKSNTDWYLYPKK